MKDIHPEKPLIDFLNIELIKKIFSYSIVIFLILIFFFIIIKYLNKLNFISKIKKDKKKLIKKEIEVEAVIEKEFLKKIEAQKKIINENNINNICINLTKIIKDYYYKKYINNNEINLLESTTKEIECSKNIIEKIEKKDFHFLIKILKRIDEIKFLNKNKNIKSTNQICEDMLIFLKHKLKN